MSDGHVAGLAKSSAGRDMAQHAAASRPATIRSSCRRRAKGINYLRIIIRRKNRHYLIVHGKNTIVNLHTKYISFHNALFYKSRMQNNDTVILIIFVLIEIITISKKFIIGFYLFQR